MDTEDQDPLSGSPDAGQTADPVEPAPGASTAPDWDSPDNPWKTRFEGYRPEADRKITRLSQYEQAVQDFQSSLASGNTAEARRAAAVLGIADALEIEDPPPPTYDDPTDELSAKYAALEEKFNGLRGELTAKEAKDAEQAQIREIQGRLDKLDLDPSDRDMVLGLALTRDPGEDGLPDVKAAHDLLVARDKALKQGRDRAYRDGKKSAPGSIAPGSTATQQKKPTDMLSKDGTLTQEGLDHYTALLEDRA